MANEKIVYEIDIDVDHAVEGGKELTSTLDKTKESISGMNDGLKKVGDSIKNFDVKGVVSGLGAMTKSALAFIATPLGAAIAVISAAIFALTKYFKGSEEGQNRLNRIMNIGAAIMGKFGDAVQAVGKFIVDNLIKGFDLIGGVLSKVIPGFDELTKKVSAFLNLDTATQISNLEEEIVLLNRRLILERDQLKAEIETAKLRAESTKNVKERTAALAEVETKVKELFSLERQLAEKELQAAEQRATLSNNTIEDNDKLAEAKAKLAQLNREESAMLKENATKQLALNEQRQKEIDLINQKKSLEENAVIEAQVLAQIQEEENLKMIENDMAIQAQKQLNAEEDMLNSQMVSDLEIENQEKVTANFDDATRRRMANMTAQDKYRKQLMAAGLSEEQANARIHKEIEAQKLAATSDALGAGLSLFKQNTVAYKVTAAAKATIDTYQAANLALSNYPMPFGGIMAALAIALGLLNVAKITGVAAAGGADFVTKGPTMLLVGDNPGGREHVQVTPLSGRGQTRTFSGGIAMAGGGSLTTGPAIASAQTAPIEAQFALNDAIKNMPAPVLDFTEYTNFTNKVAFKETLTSG